MTDPSMTHPIKRASVEQARELWADTVEPLGYPKNAATIRSGDLDPFQEATAGIIAKLLEDRQQARDAGFAEGWAKATAWHKHGIAWKHLERVSQDELLAEARAALSAEANEGRCDG